jgi:hypothetical protein
VLVEVVAIVYKRVVVRALSNAVIATPSRRAHMLPHARLTIDRFLYTGGSCSAVTPYVIIGG